ncbi:hypothetical protein [Cellulomonas sp. GbtcB1]|uniref:hypothetical protein n=1 Tax=Cellulomonas sp. GbtcB1 TaxID=2824746 RepID=UPI001C31181D|nr:hypothetical protein [Cellulomonas sp. GbtcB1]
MVDGRRFSFPPGWLVSKYDEWDYYRTKFQALANSKAVDLVAVEGASATHLIEVKDYTHPESQPVPLDELPWTVAAKCRDTLAGLGAARTQAQPPESTIADAALKAASIRVVLHIELSTRRGGRLSNPRKTLADLQTALRLKLKAIDPHATVQHDHTQNASWSSRPEPPAP